MFDDTKYSDAITNDSDLGIRFVTKHATSHKINYVRHKRTIMDDVTSFVRNDPLNNTSRQKARQRHDCGDTK